MTSTYKVISNLDGKNFHHELTIKSKVKKNKTVHELYHSNHETWSAHTRGQHILTLIDHGNGYKLKYAPDISNLDYDEAEYVYVIFKHAIINYGTASFKLKHKIKKIK